MADLGRNNRKKPLFLFMSLFVGITLNNNKSDLGWHRAKNEIIIIHSKGNLAPRF